MTNWDIDSSLENFKAIASEFQQFENLNESDTRAKLITNILTNCMGWNERDIEREEYDRSSGTYLDYKLSTNLPVLIVEAKRSSREFPVPKSTSQREFKLGGVVSDLPYLLDTIEQARGYALQKGVQNCCITNGFQYAFFKASNLLGKDWTDHKVAIFKDFSDIGENYAEFCDYLSKASYENGIINKLLKFEDNEKSDSKRYQTLETLHLSHPRKKNRNSLFYHLEEIVRKVFQDLASEDAETEILEHCYVDSPRKKDKALPYLDFQAERLQVDKKSAGDFQRRVVALLTNKENPKPEVIFLLGSVGVGKSTFIQRFRKVLAKEYVDELGIWIYLDFRNFSDTGDTLDDFVRNQLSDTLATEYEDLNLEDWSFIKSAYHAEYNRMKKGHLKPIYENDFLKFEEKFSEFISEEMRVNPTNHLEKLLKHASSKYSRKIFLIFDNADQLSPDTQSEIFLLAQKISTRLKGSTLISMREESYWKNRDSGPLNAFHTIAYHVQAPKLEQVLAKRFHYAKSLISTERMHFDYDNTITSEELNEIIDRIQQTLLGQDKSYIDFISAVAPRDNRRALDDIAAFIVSGHTNLNALLKDIRKPSPTGLTVPFHEFLNSVILRDHESFIESKSSIINIFNATGSTDISTSNRLAVLGRVLSAKNENSEVGTGYLLIEDLINDCKEVGILEETTLEVLSILNSRRLIETETTIKDSLSESRYVRATSAGDYYINHLSISFGYLDIISLSTPLSDEHIFREMKSIREQIANLNPDKTVDRLKRIKYRVSLVRTFVEYLANEIRNSKFITRRDLYSESIREYPETLLKQFESESKIVIENATRVFTGSDQ